MLGLLQGKPAQGMPPDHLIPQAFLHKALHMGRKDIAGRADYRYVLPVHPAQE